MADRTAVDRHQSVVSSAWTEAQLALGYTHGLLSGEAQGNLFRRQLASLLAVYWPVSIIALGIIPYSRRMTSSWWPSGIMLMGAFLLGWRLQVLPASLWIITGVAMLAVAGVLLIMPGSMRRSLLRLQRDYQPDPQQPVREIDSRVRAQIYCSGITLVSASQTFQGGSVATVLGQVVVDLRQANFDVEGGRLELSATCGKITLLVPREWSVRVSSAYSTRRRHHNQRLSFPAKVKRALTTSLAQIWSVHDAEATVMGVCDNLLENPRGTRRKSAVFHIKYSAVLGNIVLRN